MYYYDIHVMLGRTEGYSIGLASDKVLNDTEAVAEAVKQKRFPTEGDEENVDEVNRIGEQEYKETFGDY